MIPLKIKAQVRGSNTPFVVRLRLTEHDRTHGNDAILVSSEGGISSYRSTFGEVRLSGVTPLETANDVILVVPHQGIAHRLIRASSQHNTLLVTERCDQLCVMCSQPPKTQHIDVFEHLEAAALLAPPNALIGLSGGEPTLFKGSLLGLLERCLRQRPDLTFHVLSNGQHFDTMDLNELRGLPLERILWGIPLYSPLPFQHDALVAKAGAFERLLESFRILASVGASIELRTVVMTPNVPVLPLLATFIANNLPFVSRWALMQLESIGYGRKNWSELFFDNSNDFGMVGRALDIVHGRGIEAQLYNFPLCTVPEPYRRYAPSTISDWKRKYLTVCSECPVQKRCSGFFEWYSEGRGFAKVGL